MEIELKNTIIGKIALDSLTNPAWNNLTTENAEKKIEELATAENISNEITDSSEIAVANAIVKILNLQPKHSNQLLGSTMDGEIYTCDKISENIAAKIRRAFENSKGEQFVLDILSEVHNSWVKKNEEKFLKEGRNKEYQFVPLLLLDWDEAKSDLLFLKPIIEASGIEIDEESLKKYFVQEQEKYLESHGIESREDLAELIKKGKDFYPTLENLETRKGGDITEQLESDKVASRMSKQIFDRNIERFKKYKLQEDILMSKDNTGYGVLIHEIIGMEKYGDVISVPVEQIAISYKSYLLKNELGEFQKRDIELQEKIAHEQFWGKLEPSFLVTESFFFHPEGKLDHEELAKVYLHRSKIEEELAKAEKDESGKYDVIGKVGRVHISQRQLLEIGILPEELNWKPHTNQRILPNDIAEADHKKELNSSEVARGKGIIKRLLDIFKNRGEK